MKGIKALVVSAVIILFTGCAATPQNPIDLSENFFANSNHKIGIISSALPKNDVHILGAGCLLCLAAAEAANSNLSKHVDTLSQDDLLSIPENLSETLNEIGVENHIISEPIVIRDLPKHKSELLHSTKKDFSKFKNHHDITHLLVIEYMRSGMHRTYANYFPTSDPKGFFEASAFLVNLSTNTYEWYKPINIIESVNDEWKEPPNFPALTNAYYRAIAKGKDEIFSLLPR